MLPATKPPRTTALQRLLLNPQSLPCAFPSTCVAVPRLYWNSLRVGAVQFFALIGISPNSLQVLVN